MHFQTHIKFDNVFLPCHLGIKRPVRDACLHMGGILAKGPPAPQVCLPIASLLVDRISSNLAHIFSSPGKIF